MITIMVLVIVEGVLFPESPTSHPQTVPFVRYIQDRGLFHLSMSVQDIHLVMVMVMVMVMVKVVWVVGQPTLPIREFIVELIVVILCHIRVRIFHP